MPETSLPTVWQAPDSTQYAALSFLARYRGDTEPVVAVVSVPIGSIATTGSRCAWVCG